VFTQTGVLDMNFSISEKSLVGCVIAICTTIVLLLVFKWSNGSMYSLFCLFGYMFAAFAGTEELRTTTDQNTVEKETLSTT
jgi:hypothetical protein